MTFTKAAHRRHTNKFFTAVKQRGGGSIGIQQPGVAATDHVSEAWLHQHESALPLGTIITPPGGRPYTIEAVPLPGMERNYEQCT